MIQVWRYGRVLLGLALVMFSLLWWLDRQYPLSIGAAAQPSNLVLDAQGRVLRGYTNTAGNWCLPSEVNTVDPLYLRMLLAYEDQRFDTHLGVDPLALLRAVSQRLWYGRTISGGSTLSMQTVRLLEPRPRTVRSKLIEIFRALQLEWYYEKPEILRLYLQLAPFGGNLQGVRAASWAYLGKEPNRLTPAEAALLVVLPQSPTRLRPQLNPQAAQAARDKVLRRMAELGVLSTQQAQEALQESVPTLRRPLPFLAPHLADRLRLQQPTNPSISTLIDSELQRTLESMARAELNRLEPGANIAMLVVRNQGREVLAYIGGADFQDPRRAGQLDLTRAIRSPGSTLKPLIYGMGFDDFLIHPETLVMDAPTRFGGYQPSNFDPVYLGQISVREALQRSLNIPAVAVLEQVGPERVDARLRDVGLPLRWGGPNPRPGLPLVLGGVGTTLEHLVTLYSAFADQGQVRPLRYTTTLTTDNSVRSIISPAATWQLTRILEAAPPPDAVVAQGNLRQPRALAYKTGTSYGFRDAWALGYDRDYTVGIWVGRPDGSPSPGHYGRNTAAPLLWRVFDLLPMAPSAARSTPPDGVTLASNTQLPERLRQLRRTDGLLSLGGPPPPSIRFPVDNSRVELNKQAGQWQVLPLQAAGGQRPLRWLVNDAPLTTRGIGRETDWLPDGEGLARITVIDALGRSASAEVWIVGREQTPQLSPTEVH